MRLYLYSVAMDSATSVGFVSLQLGVSRSFDLSHGHERGTLEDVTKLSRAQYDHSGG